MLAAVIFSNLVLAGPEDITPKQLAKMLKDCKNKCSNGLNACIKDADKMYKQSIKVKSDAKSKKVAKLMLDNKKNECKGTKNSCANECDSNYGPRGAD